MLFELNALAARQLILQHKLIEVIKVAPRFVAEYLLVDYENKTRERWQEFIFRQVHEIKDFALMPDEYQTESIGENHKAVARKKRLNMTKTSHHLDELLGQELKIQAKGILKEI